MGPPSGGAVGGMAECWGGGIPGNRNEGETVMLNILLKPPQDILDSNIYYANTEGKCYHSRLDILQKPSIFTGISSYSPDTTILYEYYGSCTVI